MSGAGGRSFWAEGGAAQTSNGANNRWNGATGINGSGGSGAIQTNNSSPTPTGGSGGLGVVVIHEF
jgi:hypothetical protein